MSQKRERERRAIESLLSEAHRSVHLLLDLGAAITEREAAVECNAQADALGRALRRALQYLLGDTQHQSPGFSRDMPGNPGKPGFSARTGDMQRGARHG